MGHSLWALNRRHLGLLEGYVAASLREREHDEQWRWRNASLASRLTAWMTSASNRGAVLEGLRALREKAQFGD